MRDVFSPTVGATIKKPKSSKISQASLKALDVALRNLGVALRYFSRAEFLAPHLFENPLHAPVNLFLFCIDG